MANNSAEHRTAEEIALEKYPLKEKATYIKDVGAVMLDLNASHRKIYLEGYTDASQQVKAKDDELARVTKLLEKLYRHHGSWIKTDLVDKAWNDYKTKNEIR